MKFNLKLFTAGFHFSVVFYITSLAAKFSNGPIFLGSQFLAAKVRKAGENIDP